MQLKKYKISLRNGESVSYDFAAFLIFLTFSVIVASMNTPLNDIYAKAIAISIGGIAKGAYVIYNSTAFQITNLCLGLIEVGAILLLFFFDRNLKNSIIPIFLIILFNYTRIILSIMVGYEALFRVLFELSVFGVWLLFRNNLRLKFIHLSI